MELTVIDGVYLLYNSLCCQLHEASLVTDLQVLNEKIEQAEAICLLYDTSAEESFRFAADLHVSLYCIKKCVCTQCSLEFHCKLNHCTSSLSACWYKS